MIASFPVFPNRYSNLETNRKNILRLSPSAVYITFNIPLSLIPEVNLYYDPRLNNLVYFSSAAASFRFSSGSTSILVSTSLSFFSAFTTPNFFLVISSSNSFSVAFSLLYPAVLMRFSRTGYNFVI